MNDCALHTCVVPVLLSDNMQINIFGKTTEEKYKAGIEMRRRMALTLFRKKIMFETSDSTNLLGDLPVDVGTNDYAGYSDASSSQYE